MLFNSIIIIVVYRTCLLDVKQLSCILSAVLSYMLHYDNIYYKYIFIAAYDGIYGYGLVE